MGAKLKLNKDNCTLEEILTAKNCAPTNQGFQRFLILEFMYRDIVTTATQAASYFSKDRKTIQRIISIFNQQGIDGLVIRGKSGRTRKIDANKFQATYVPLVLDPDSVGESHWSAIKFHGYICNEHKEQLSYSTLLNYFHENNLSQVKGRPHHEKQDDYKRKIFIEQFQNHHKNNAEIWFSDESGFEGDPRPRSLWVTKGTKPKIKRSHDHLRFQAIGAVNPTSGEFISLALPYSDTYTFQVFLDHLDKETNSRKIILVLDNASWHKASSLNWHSITPLYLAPYSPDLNPIENIWKLLKSNFFNNWYAKDMEQLITRICQALKWLINTPEQSKSTANMDYLLKK